MSPFQAPILLISERFGLSGGGEAIKGQHYADVLLAQGADVTVVTHERSMSALGGVFPPDRVILVHDDALQRAIWRIGPLQGLLSPIFHWKARGLIQKAIGARPRPLLHYISPVSPVAPRFIPRGFKAVIGPMTGNIYYPPGFAHRMSGKDRLRAALHGLSQRALRLVLPEKRRAGALLVSGYERTRASLRLAGASEAQMHDVVDAGVEDKLLSRPRLTHQGVHGRFVTSGRMVDHKGTDLAIKALSRTDPSLTLDIYGEGPMRGALEALVASLGLGARVRFMGWVKDHDALIEAFGAYRGYVFPSLAEANGIVMQEAMAVGLPVVTLRWGGPSRLADDDSALYVTPHSEDQVVTEIAAAMDRLARDGAFADGLAAKARALAEARFAWPVVAASWQACYPNRVAE